MLRRLAVISLGILAALPAGATARICNQGSAEQQIALGYTSEGQWVSQGWFHVSPGRCEELGVLAEDGPFYWFSTAAGFAGEGYAFCTEPGSFYIEGDGDCEARGKTTANFAQLTFPEGGVFTITDGGAAAAELPVIDLSRPFTPPPPPAAPAGGMPADSGSAEEDDVAYISGLSRGEHGESFDLEGVWQGCETGDGTSYCAFHAEGWKFFAYDGGAEPPEYMQALREIPVGAPVRVIGDVMSEGDISAEVALVEVTVHPDDPYGTLRSQMQGDWVSADDPKYRMTVNGSEAYEFYDGEQTGTRFLRIANDCDSSAGTGPVLLTTTVPGFETECFLFQDGLPGRMVLAVAGQGGYVTFDRP